MPVDFLMAAKTTATTGEEKEVIISNFRQYVQRFIIIPAGTDPGQIITGAAYNADGTFSHVPTIVFSKDGTCYARINSLTNSSYVLIYNPVEVASAENHWSKKACL